MTKKLLITLSILTLFANATKASDNNSATHDEGVVINGIRWATRNVDMPGTFAETPESFGMLFQWNRKKAWNAVDEEVEGWDSSIPEGTKWYAENDPCPEGWRVPTYEELKSFDNASSTGSEWIFGDFFGTAPNQIFLPAVRWRNENNGRLNYRSDIRITSGGGLWSSTQHGNSFAHALWFASGGSMSIVGQRAKGLSIRCVAK